MRWITKLPGFLPLGVVELEAFFSWLPWQGLFFGFPKMVGFPNNHGFSYQKRSFSFLEGVLFLVSKKSHEVKYLCIFWRKMQPTQWSRFFFSNATLGHPISKFSTGPWWWNVCVPRHKFGGALCVWWVVFCVFFFNQVSEWLGIDVKIWFVNWGNPSYDILRWWLCLQRYLWILKPKFDGRSKVLKKSHQAG